MEFSLVSILQIILIAFVIVIFGVNAIRLRRLSKKINEKR